MTIYRDGKAIELTEYELNQAWLECHEKHIRYDVESCLEDWGLSFKTFSDFGYDSEETFRSAFIEECVKEADDLLDSGYSRDGCITEAVSTIMEDYDVEVT